MKKQEIICNASGVEIGRKIFELPETLTEAMEMYGETVVFELFEKANIVVLRRSLQPTMAEKEQKKVYEKLITAGIEESIARQVSDYNG